MNWENPELIAYSTWIQFLYLANLRDLRNEFIKSIFLFATFTALKQKWKYFKFWFIFAIIFISLHRFPNFILFAISNSFGKGYIVYNLYIQPIIPIRLCFLASFQVIFDWDWVLTILPILYTSGFYTSNSNNT